MSSTTEPQTFLELQNDFISRMRASGSTVNTEIAKRLLNTALVNCHLNPGHKFPWAERRGVIITHAPYTTGTVSITTATSRTAVTGSGTAWTTNPENYGNNVRAGGKIKFAGSNDHYVVDSVGSGTALTLASSYVGDDLSGATYTYFEDEYALAADFLRMVDMRNFSTDLHIPLIGRTDFRRMFPRNDIRQRPKVATLIQIDFSASTAPQYRVVFNPTPADVYQIPYWYVTKSLAVDTSGVRQERMVENTDEPIIPKGKRHMLTLYAMYEYYRDYKDDARAMAALGEYEKIMGRISGELNDSDSKPRFFVRGRRIRDRHQRFDYGNRFDQLDDR